MPSDFSITIDGRGRRYLIHFDNIPRSWRKGIKKGLNWSGIAVMKETRRLIESGPKTGRKYSGLPNRSSAPGEAPANQSGRLVRSGYHKVRGWDQLEVGERIHYAAYLEHDQTGRRIAPRPHLRTAIAIKGRDVQRYLMYGVERSIRPK